MKTGLSKDALLILDHKKLHRIPRAQRPTHTIQLKCCGAGAGSDGKHFVERDCIGRVVRTNCQIPSRSGAAVGEALSMLQTADAKVCTRELAHTPEARDLRWARVRVRVRPPAYDDSFFRSILVIAGTVCHAAAARIKVADSDEAYMQRMVLLHVQLWQKKVANGMETVNEMLVNDLAHTMFLAQSAGVGEGLNVGDWLQKHWPDVHEAFAVLVTCARYAHDRLKRLAKPQT